MKSNSKKCPCGKELSYKECCGISHANPEFIKTAEDLMRSRYVAFTMGNGDYLVETHHSDSKDKIEKEKLQDWANSVRWIRLEVLKSENGQEGDADGMVEFRASYQDGKRFKAIHEKSIFKRENGAWVYWGTSD